MKKIIILSTLLAFLLINLVSCIPLITYPFGDITNESGTDSQMPDDETIAKLINETAPTLLLSNVVVTVTHHSYLETVSSQGSGVIFRETSNYLYVLTNHHVVHYDDAIRSVFNVRDAFDNTYTATLVAKDGAYDLAVLKISRNENTNDLTVAKIAKINAPIDTAVISVGNPGGVHNSVSVGSIIYVKDITNDSLDVEVLYHTAPLEHGSSGGGIFDSDGNLVGINYAVGTDSETGRQMSFAVPVYAIREFLSKNRLLPTEG